jgi:hypothetical protein
MSAETRREAYSRLFASERKTPTMRNERQMIVVEKAFLPLYCQRLPAAGPARYFSLRAFRTRPFV